MHAIAVYLDWLFWVFKFSRVRCDRFDRNGRINAETEELLKFQA